VPGALKPATGRCMMYTTDAAVQVKPIARETRKKKHHQVRECR